MANNHKLETEFLTAVKNNQLEELKTILIDQNNFNIYCTNEKGLNALFIATANNNLEVIQLLLSNSFSIFCTTKWGENALFFAAEKGYLSTLQYLLSQGLDKSIQIADIKGNTILHYAAMGNLDTFKYLISIGCEVSALGDYQRNCLHYAAMGGNLEIVKFLTNNDQIIIDINYKDVRGMNAFHYAADEGHVNVMQYLIEKGIDFRTESKLQTNALLIATKNAQRKAIEYLISINFDINKVNEYGSNAIHIAANDGNIPLIKYFLSRGLDVNATNRYSQTALSLSITNFEIVKLLLKHGADINLLYPYNRSILHLAKLKKSKQLQNEDVCNLIILRSLEDSFDLERASYFKVDQWKNTLIGSLTCQTPLTDLKDDFGLYFRNYSSQFFINVKNF